MRSRSTTLPAATTLAAVVLLGALLGAEGCSSDSATIPIDGAGTGGGAATGGAAIPSGTGGGGGPARGDMSRSSGGATAGQVTAGTGGETGVVATGDAGSDGSAAGGASVDGGVVMGTGGASLGGRSDAGMGAGASGGRAPLGTGGSHVGGAGGRPGGSGAAGGGVAGSAGRPGVSGGSGGAAGAGPAAPGGRVTGYGLVRLAANSQNQIVRLQTTLTVPAKPAATGTLFLWPGLQPGGANLLPIDNGVLQPVLTWGRSCAPGTQPKAYSTWWISAQYVNTYGKAQGYTGCSGGPVMSVEVGDPLQIDMQLTGTVWNQTVTDAATGASVSFSKDMMGQAQNSAYFDVEEYSASPVSTVVFTDTTLTFGSADTADCKLSMRGQTDFVSVPQPSPDGLQCKVAQIVLRAQGIP